MFRFLVLVMLAATPIFAAAAQSELPLPRYVGSENCVACHADAAEAWEGSHHAWAWTQPSEATVLGDFNGTVFEHKGTVTRFSRDNGDYIMETTEQDGTINRHIVHSVAGIEPLQQYLIETQTGRLQSHDVVWDIEKKRWYHLYPDQDLKPGEGLHWTGPYKNWNARCAECHATGFKKNYSPATRSYASIQSETGVSCEACHGPGEAHLAWAQQSGGIDTGRWRGVNESGFTIDFEAGSAETEIQLCAACHSRREPLTDGNPLPGTAYHDTYRLALLREGLYHPDGSIQDEVYVYGSFLQSKMYQRGVRCTDCHEPHTADLKADGNAVCTQCHSPAGNSRFPTLRLADYNDPAHHFHEPGSEGARCASCHMIERAYMGIDWRRDHSFRIPRPDLSITIGAPNACTDCHADRDASWAAAEIAERFPDSAHRGPHFAEAFASARQNPSSTVDLLLAIAEDEDEPGIVRASALDMLRPVADAEIAARAAPLIGHGEALVRAAAVTLQRGAAPNQRLERLVPALDDTMQSVRISAARELLDAPIFQLPPAIATALQGALAEWRASLLAKADYPEAHLAIGGAALVLRNPRAGEQAFREAAYLDPQHVQAWTMVVRILAATGDMESARTTLDNALAVNPSSEALQSLSESLSANGG